MFLSGRSKNYSCRGNLKGFYCYFSTSNGLPGITLILLFLLFLSSFWFLFFFLPSFLPSVHPSFLPFSHHSFISFLLFLPILPFLHSFLHFDWCVCVTPVQVFIGEPQGQKSRHLWISHVSNSVQRNSGQSPLQTLWGNWSIPWQLEKPNWISSE